MIPARRDTSAVAIAGLRLNDVFVTSEGTRKCLQNLARESPKSFDFAEVKIVSGDGEKKYCKIIS
jgi:hypothetical protein